MTELNENIQKAIKLIEIKKKEIKDEKDKKIKAETRIEENLKGLEEDYKEVKSLGFNPEKLDEEIEKIDKILEKYNDEILDCIQKLNG